MGDTFLKHVPRDVRWRPAPEVAERARAKAEELFAYADEVEATTYDAVQMFHPLENWDGVSCPVCRTDLEAWWHEVLEGIADGGFEDFSVVTPCCGKATTLRDLSYFNAPAFGMFELSVMYPNAEPTPQIDQAIEAALGTPTDKVWAHL